MSQPWPPGTEPGGPWPPGTDPSFYTGTDLATVKVPGGEMARQWPDGTLPGLPGQEPPPVASFTCSPPAPGRNMNATLDGTSSQPGSADFPVTAYGWAFSDGTAPMSGAVVTWRTPSKAGSYTVTLTVTDSGGESGQASQAFSM